jgi:hypothetical protein
VITTPSAGKACLWQHGRAFLRAKYANGIQSFDVTKNQW